MLPALLVAALGSVLVGRAVDDDRARTSALAAEALRADAVTDASAWVSAETTFLLALGALDGAPGQLAFFRASTDAMAGSMTRDQLLVQLDSSDDAGVRAGRRLAAVGVHDPSIDAVLAPLADDVRRAIADGRTALVPAAPYADAFAAMQGMQRDADARAEAAADTLLSISGSSSFRTSTSFFTVVATLAALAGATGLLAAWRVATATARTRRELAELTGRADALGARGERLRTVVGTARRVASGTDSATVRHGLVHEAAVLLDAAVSLYVRTPDGFAPAAASDRSPATRPVGPRAGAVGRCADSATTERAVVPGDPAIDAPGEAWAVLAAPLVGDGNVFGVLLATRPGTALFDETDEMTLHMLALVAAGSLQTAARLDTTTALAFDDPLTGLRNRRRLDADLAAATADPSIGRVAFLMVDIDHFKAYNDRHGHPAGDELLRLVGRALASAVREGDTTYRYGGEEFSVLLPGASDVEALAVAERVRAAVAALDVSAPVTVSVGAASTDHADHALDLVHRADVALYDAKRAGRNRVVHAAAR